MQSGRRTAGKIRVGAPSANSQNTSGEGALAGQFAREVASHWAIENQFHWQLDVPFREDHSRIRQGHADVNFGTLRKTALVMLKNETIDNVGIKEPINVDSQQRHDRCEEDQHRHRAQAEIVDGDARGQTLRRGVHVVHGDHS
jgi:hypothetical protein